MSLGVYRNSLEWRQDQDWENSDPALTQEGNPWLREMSPSVRHEEIMNDWARSGTKEKERLTHVFPVDQQETPPPPPRKLTKKYGRKLRFVHDDGLRLNKQNMRGWKHVYTEEHRSSAERSAASWLNKITDGQQWERQSKAETSADYLTWEMRDPLKEP